MSNKEMNNVMRIILVCVVMATVVCACTKRERGERGLRSVYYWSTVYELDSAERAFLEREHVGRIYLRYFDVVVDDDGRVMPNATVRFRSEQPGGVEVVPTIYIMNECMSRDVSQLDSLLLRRVMQMSETNDITGVREIQIDCDWTMTTRKTYYDFLMRLVERARNENIQISTTIRLHQLSQPVPPVERGVLMMYNTGDVRQWDGTNPILDMRDAGPYLRYLSDYDLPLSTAYPVFEWRVLFRDKRFVGIMHSDDDYPVLSGDTIVRREASAEVVMEARRAIDNQRPDANDEVILFDLSKTNVQRINKFHYEKAFSD